MHYLVDNSYTADGASTSGVQTTTTTSGESYSITGNFNELDIQEIQKLGFTRDKILVELRNANGNKTQAIAALFAKSFKF